MTTSIPIEHICKALSAINDPLMRATVATRLAIVLAQEVTCLHQEILNCLGASHDDATRGCIIRVAAPVMGHWGDGLDIIVFMIQRMKDPWQQATCFEALAKVTSDPLQATFITAGLRAAADIEDPRNRAMVSRWIGEIPLSPYLLQEQ